MEKTALILLLFILTGFGVKAQTYLLQEDFSSITTGDNMTTSGSGTTWNGDTSFPSVVKAYQAGGVVKLGTSSATGSITSKQLDLSANGGNFKISFDVKGWTTVEGSIVVTVTSLTSQTVTYTATMSSSSFENKVLSFTGGTANSTVKIETTTKRTYIDNINVYYITATPTLTVTDVTDITLNTIINNPVTQTINISAVNLSTNLGMSITGTDAALFSLSQYSIGLTGGSVPTTPITVTYSPTAIGNHTATLTMSSTGAINLIRTLTGISTNVTGINDVQKPLNVYVTNGNIAFTADPGETVEIYNAVGQRLVHKLTDDGVNTIPVSAKGVVLVKVENRFAKVIL